MDDRMIHGQQPLVTIRNTFGENVQFVIPDYQRGYKWTITEVRKLLEDITAFSVGGGLEYYCLQNLTLVRSTREPNLRKVVDGQQRLTTASIIISYLDYCKKSRTNPDIGDLPPLMRDNGRSLFFGARKETTTQPFFEEKILQGGIWKEVDESIREDEVWLSSEYGAQTINHLHDLFGKWLKMNPGADYNHSDIFHMFCAAMTVASFFKKHEGVILSEFAPKFLDKVRFLHNIVEEDASSRDDGTSVIEAEIFSKINGFRVPLDGADLLRAIFITDVAGKTALGGGITEREVRLNEARLKLGLQLDEMGAWWLDKRHQVYFAMFDPYKNQESSFDLERYPINILYRLFAASKGSKHITLEWFEKQEIQTLYKEIRHFHSVLKDWYEDVKIYHYAGFLVGQCGERFCEIYNLITNADNRPALHKKLKSRMFIKLTQPQETDEEKRAEIMNTQPEFFRESLRAITDAIVSSTHNWYDEERFSVKKTLTLMDVIAFAEPDCLMVNSPDDKCDESRRQKKEKKRTPLADHLDPEFFTCEGEDKEHIFPQTPIGGKDRNNSKQLYEKMRRYLKLVSTESKKDEKDLITKWEEFWSECETERQISDNQEVFPLEFKNETESKQTLEWLFAKEGRETETISRINKFVINQCQIDLNSIGNIVMLDAHINRGYGNDFFDEKRKEIWSKYRACQPVRLHTYRVFAKEFIDNDGVSLDEWKQPSIEANRKAIKIGIEQFFNELFLK